MSKASSADSRFLSAYSSYGLSFSTLSQYGMASPWRPMHMRASATFCRAVMSSGFLASICLQ